MSFDDYLKSKSIDPVLYKTGEEVQYTKFESEFKQMHPKSFTAQKLFLINDLRRTYHFKKEQIDTQKLNDENKSSAKPVIKSKPKISSGISKPVIKKNVKPVVKKQAKPVIKRPKSE